MDMNKVFEELSKVIKNFFRETDTSSQDRVEMLRNIYENYLKLHTNYAIKQQRDRIKQLEAKNRLK